MRRRVTGETTDEEGAADRGRPRSSDHEGREATAPAKTWRRWYGGSALQAFFKGLGAVEFGDRIILFSAALLLSVLPMILLVSALASKRVDDDISQRLGLNQQGTRVVEGLFRSPAVTFNLGILVSLLLAVAGTLTVAASVQILYERAFGLPRRRGLRNVVRLAIWVAVVAGVLIADEVEGAVLDRAPLVPPSRGSSTSPNGACSSGGRCTSCSAGGRGGAGAYPRP